eukprot:c46566_g1_i1 orf=38-280(+)
MKLTQGTRAKWTCMPVINKKEPSASRRTGQIQTRGGTSTTGAHRCCATSMEAGEVSGSVERGARCADQCVQMGTCMPTPQ